MNYKQRKHRMKIFFALSAFSLILFALSFILMSPASHMALNENKYGLLYFCGVLFWGSLIASIVFIFFETYNRKKISNNEKMSSNKLPAIITFFSSKEAIIADVLMFIFLVGFIVCCIAHADQAISLFAFSIFVLTAEAHCVLNGRNYNYIKEMKAEVVSNESQN